MADASFAVTLPNTQPPPGEVMQHGMDMRERQFERMASLQEQAQRQRQINQRYQEAQAEKNTSLLNSLPKQYNSDSIDMNAVRDKFISDLNAEALDKAKSMPASDFNQWLHGRIQPMAQWFDKAKSDYDNLQKGLTEYHQELPNVSRTDARNLANMFYSHNYFKDDGTGKLTFNPDAQPVDIISKLKEPETLKHMAVDETPMLKFLSQEIPHEAISGKEVTDKQGRVHKYAWKGFRNAFSDEAPTRDENGALTLKMRSENYHNVPQIPQQLEEMINGNPQLKAIYDHKWGQAKDKLQEAGHFDPRLENVHKKAMMYNYASPIMSHPISVSEEDRTPRIRVSVNGGGKNQDVLINNAYSRINSAIGNNEDKKLSDMNLDANDVALIMQMAKNSVSANIPATPDLIKVSKDANGKAKITLDAGSTKIPLGSLSPTGVNLKANTRDKKTRQTILKGESEQSTPSTPKAAKTKGSAGIQWH